MAQRAKVFTLVIPAGQAVSDAIQGTDGDSLPGAVINVFNPTGDSVGIDVASTSSPSDSDFIPLVYPPGTTPVRSQGQTVVVLPASAFLALRLNLGSPAPADLTLSVSVI